MALECGVMDFKPMLRKKILQHIARVPTLEIIVFQTLRLPLFPSFFICLHETKPPC